jgi:hypothetical protein
MVKEEEWKKEVNPKSFIHVKVEQHEQTYTR